MSCINNTNGNTLMNTNLNSIIKFNNTDLVATAGFNTMEKIQLNDIKIPYKQILKSRLILKAGQINYLLNHLGLGDNATFLMIKATFDPRSRFEADNFIQYSYVSDRSKIYSFANMIILTGNSENRIEQLYLSNPNQTSEVMLDIMVAVIDNTVNFFEPEDETQKSKITFNNIRYTDIKIWSENVSFALYGENDIPQSYFNIADVNSFERQGKIIIIDDSSYGSIYLDFIDEYNAIQGISILTYIIENGTDPSPKPDNITPVLIFNGINIKLYGTTISATSTNGPTNSYQLQDLTLTDFTYLGDDIYTISKFDLSNLIIDKVACGDYVPNQYGIVNEFSHICNSCISSSSSTPDFNNSGCYRVYDNYDGILTIDNTSLIIKRNNIEYNDIRITGDYTISFNISDMVGNKIDNNIKIYVTVN